jgi:hypothetical protein
MAVAQVWKCPVRFNVSAWLISHDIVFFSHNKQHQSAYQPYSTQSSKIVLNFNLQATRVPQHRRPVASMLFQSFNVFRLLDQSLKRLIESNSKRVGKKRWLNL